MDYHLREELENESDRKSTTIAELRAELAKAREDALEEAAVAAETSFHGYGDDDGWQYAANKVKNNVAAAIRALKEKQP